MKFLSVVTLVPLISSALSIFAIAWWKNPKKMYSPSFVFDWPIKLFTIRTIEPSETNKFKRCKP